MSVQEDPRPWYRDALCITPEREFYDFPENKEEEKKSKSVCRVCPVRLECLAHAFSYSIDYGIWGGMMPDQRKMVATLVGISKSMKENEVLVVLIQNING